jgi:hypothetical protein
LYAIGNGSGTGSALATYNQGLFNTGNHNLGIALTGDNLIGIGPFYVLR